MITTKRLTVVGIALVLMLIPAATWATGTPSDDAGDGVGMMTGEVTFYTIDEWAKLPALVPYFESFTETFAEEHPGATATVLSDPFMTWLSKTLVMFAAGNAPDVVLTGSMYPELANGGYLADMKPLFDQAFFDDFPAAALDTYNWKGQLQASVPFTLDPKILYYNKDLFRQAGLDPEKPPVTWDEFLAAAEALSKIGVYGYSMGSLASQGFPEEGIYCSTAAGPVTKIDANGNLVPNVDTPEFRGFLQLMLDMVPYYEPDFASVDPGQSGTLFCQQKAGMIVQGPFIFDQNDIPYDTEWIGQGLVPKPTADGIGGSVGGGFAIGINAATEHPELSAELVRLIFRPGVNDKLMTNAPASISSYEASDYATNPFFATEQEQMKTAYQGTRFDLTRNTVKIAVLDTFAQVLLGSATIDDAVPALEATIADLIAQAEE
jgi:ABC-type glycerol-3-phosphate transport system substrate-binding protein